MQQDIVFLLLYSAGRKDSGQCTAGWDKVRWSEVTKIETGAPQGSALCQCNLS